MNLRKLTEITDYHMHPESKALIRFHDCDPFRHLNQSRYLDYFVSAREDQLRDNYGLDIHKFAQENGHAWMVTKNQIAYIRQVLVNEMVTMQTHVVGYDQSNIHVEMIMWDEAKVKTKALLWGTFAYVNLMESKRAIHPPELMEFFGKLKWNGTDGMTFDQRLAAMYSIGK